MSDVQAKGVQQQGAGVTGRMGGGPWAGGPHAHTLDLLDASVGALVHGTEDELGQVRIQQHPVCGPPAW